MKIKDFFQKNKFFIALTFFIICFSFFLLMFFSLESDYLWHIKAGEYMIKNKVILTRDIFSWSMLGKYWMSHEWLTEVILYSLKLVFGKVHVFIYAFLGILSLQLILFLSNKKKYLKNIPFSLFWIALSLILCFFIQARPHMISFSLLALTIWFLYDLFQHEDSKKIYFLPLVTVIWANVHGGSSNLGYLFCLMFILGGLFKFKFEKIEAKRISRKQLKKYIFIMFICMFCTCINPHGIKMFFYPYVNMLDTVMISNISEWQPTVLSDFSHYPYFLFLIFIIFIMLFSKKRIQFIDLLLLGIVCFLGLKSIRFWAYTYIVITYVIFNYVPNRKHDKGTVPMIFVISCLILFIFVNSTDKILKDINKRYLDNKLIELIKDVNPSRLYNMYDYGGELIYNDILVFIDGRADLYSKHNFEDYLDISKLSGDYVKLIDKYNFDYFLVSKSYPINTYLKYSGDYEKIYDNNKYIFYKKKVQQ